MRLETMTAKQTRDWLKKCGWKAKHVDKLKLGTPEERRAALKALHNGDSR